MTGNKTNKCKITYFLFLFFIFFIFICCWQLSSFCVSLFLLFVFVFCFLFCFVCCFLCSTLITTKIKNSLINLFIYFCAVLFVGPKLFPCSFLSLPLHNQFYLSQEDYVTVGSTLERRGKRGKWVGRGGVWVGWGGGICIWTVGTGSGRTGEWELRPHPWAGCSSW